MECILFGIDNSGHIRRVKDEKSFLLWCFCLLSPIKLLQVRYVLIILQTPVMNYYHITTGIDDSDASDNDIDDGENHAIISGIRRGGVGNDVNQIKPQQPNNQEHSSLHQAVNKCLSERTVHDIMKEYDKNSDNQNNNNNNAEDGVKVRKTQVENTNNNGVVMRRKSNSKSSSYSHRASQR